MIGGCRLQESAHSKQRILWRGVFYSKTLGKRQVHSCVSLLSCETTAAAKDTSSTAGASGISGSTTGPGTVIRLDAVALQALFAGALVGSTRSPGKEKKRKMMQQT